MSALSIYSDHASGAIEPLYLANLVAQIQIGTALHSPKADLYEGARIVWKRPFAAALE